MLNLIQTEFLRLRRRSTVFWMLLAAWLMPLVGVFYFGDDCRLGLDPIRFFKWASFSYTAWIVLPIVLGIFASMLMVDENRLGILYQFWIVPVHRSSFFLSKFLMVMIYALCFMLVSASASLISGLLSGCVTPDRDAVVFLFRKCLEIGSLTAFTTAPVLAAAGTQRGYLLPVCLTIVYTFFGFILLGVNPFLHPISSAMEIVLRDVPGVVLSRPSNLPAAFFCIGIWCAGSAAAARMRVKGSWI